MARAMSWAKVARRVFSMSRRWRRARRRASFWARWMWSCRPLGRVSTLRVTRFSMGEGTLSEVGQLVACEEVHVKVGYGLTGVGALVHDDAVAADGDTLASCHFLGDDE